MKKPIFVILFNLVLAGALLLTACNNAFDPPAAPDSAKTGSALGTIRVVFGDNSFSRTLLPSTAFDHYTFTFTNESGGDPVVIAKSAGDPLEFTLEPGSWKLDVRAYKGSINDSNLAATGSTGYFAIAEGTVPVINIKLNGVSATGTGNFSYIIRYPQDAEIEFILRYAGNPVDLTSGAAAASAGGYITLSHNLEVPAGYPILVLNITRPDGSYTGDIQTVYLYNNTTVVYGSGENPVAFPDNGFVQPSVPVTGITVSPNTLSLTVGGTRTLTAVAAPDNASNKSVTWTSSDTAVATVSASGLVTARAAGSAVITARSVSDTAISGTAALTVIPSYNNTGTTVTTWKNMAVATQTGTAGTGTAYTSYQDSTGTYTDVLRVTAPSVGYTGWGGEALQYPSGSNNTIAANSIVNVKMLVWVENTLGESGIHVYWQGRGTDFAQSAHEALGDDQFGTWIPIDQTFTLGNAAQMIALMGSNSGNAGTFDSATIGLKHATVYIRNVVITVNSSTVVDTRPPVPLESFVINGPDPLTVEPGTTAQLTTTLTPAEAKANFTWKTSSATVATVSSGGVVTPVSQGTATITAESDNGKTAAITVNVPKAEVRSITLSQTAAFTMTVGDSRALTVSTSPAGATPKSVKWTIENLNTVNTGSSYNPVKLDSTSGVASLANRVTAINVDKDPAKTGTYTLGETGKARVTVEVESEDGNKYSASVEVTSSIRGQTAIGSVPLLKTTLKQYFGTNIQVGNTSDSGNPGNFSHFDAITPGNNMKPDKYGNTPGGASFGTPDAFVSAVPSGMSIHAHTLIWHNKTQIARWMRELVKKTPEEQEANKAQALAYMKSYITAVMNNYKNNTKITAWDLTNEIISDSASSNWKNSLRGKISFTDPADYDSYYAGSSTFGTDDGSPWYTAIGPDYVVEAFKAARAANPGVKLLCNDYNLDVSANKRAAYVAMITEINNLGKENGWAEYGGRPLIDGIGVQAHFNSEDTGIETNTRTMLNAFQGLRNQFPGFEVVITELDATTTSYAHWQSIRIKNASGAVQGGDSSALTEEDLDSGNYHFFPENKTDPADEISIDVIKARLAQAKSSEALLIQAKMYALAFKVYSEPAFSGLISRITIWGINDEASWRKESKPLFFEQKNIGGSSQIRAKPAFYAISDPAKYIRDHSGWN